MRNMIKIEIIRAFNNRSLFYSILIGLIITISHFVYYVIPLSNDLDKYLALNKPMMYPGWLFSSWIGGNLYNLHVFLYYLLIPILAVIPFADTFFLDKKEGFTNNVFIRTNKKYYFISKFLATFTVGGLAIVIPLVANFLLTAMFLPSMIPEVSSGFYTIDASSMWSTLFYTHPFIYLICFFLIDFVFSGLIATIALAVSYFVEHRFVVLITPFLLYLFVFAFFNLLGAISLAPINFLQPSFSRGNILIIFVETILLGVTTAFIFYSKGMKDDTF